MTRFVLCQRRAFIAFIYHSNRFENDVNTFPQLTSGLPHLSLSTASGVDSFGLNAFTENYSKKIDPENIWYHSLVLLWADIQLICFSYLDVYLFYLWMWSIDSGDFNRKWWKSKPMKCVGTNNVRKKSERPVWNGKIRGWKLKSPVAFDATREQDNISPSFDGHRCSFQQQNPL